MLRILSSFTRISMVLYLIILLIVYAYLPERVGLLFADTGEPVYSFSRDAFFYTFLLLFIILQWIFYLFSKHILASRFNKPPRQILGTWFQGLMLMINIFFILMTLFMGLANNAIDYPYSRIGWLSYVGPWLIILWILLFPVFFLRYRQDNRKVSELA